jgi:hypothetical protein
MTWLLMFSSMGLSRRWKMTGKNAARGKKHGFYGRALNEAERLELEEARGIDGIDEEIAILRVKLRELIVAEPRRFDLHLRLATTIARLVTTRYNITKEQKRSLREAITKVLTEIAIPLGIKVLVK